MKDYAFSSINLQLLMSSWQSVSSNLLLINSKRLLLTLIMMDHILSILSMSIVNASSGAIQKLKMRKKNMSNNQD